MSNPFEKIVIFALLLMMSLSGVIILISMTEGGAWLKEPVREETLILGLIMIISMPIAFVIFDRFISKTNKKSA